MSGFAVLLLLVLGIAATATGLYALSTVRMLRAKAHETGDPPSWEGIRLLFEARGLVTTAGLLIGAGVGQLIFALVLALKPWEAG